MSADEGDGPVGTREVAYRVFAAEFDDADYSHRDSDEERAPSYVITPSGAKANRLFLVGVLTEVEDVNEDMLRARIVDPTGAFVVYAGQYQPDARTFFERTDPPQFVAVSGKARTFEPDDGDRVFTSVRPEGVSAVDADTRDRWVVDAARQTVDRVGAMASAVEAGADGDPATAGLDPAGGIALALDHYGTTPGYLAALRDLALDATRVVAGERDEVTPLSADPDDPSPADLAALAALGGGDAAPIEPADAGTETDSEPAAEPTADDDEPAESDAPEPGDDGATEVGSAEAEEPAEPADEATEPADAAAGSDDATAESGDATGGSGAEATDAAAPDDELGDFEPGGLTAGEDEGGEPAGESDADAPAEADEADAEDPPDVGDEMYEFDDEERREIEEEYGAEFSTGTEVDAPGEAGIETPGPEDTDGSEPGEGSADEGSEPEAEPAVEDAGSGTGDDEPAEPAAAGDDSATPEATDDEPAEPEEVDEEPGTDVALDELVIERMRELDDGDGADREELIAAVVDETGADPGAVEDAIQDALMGGQCYEPADDRLKPI